MSLVAITSVKAANRPFSKKQYNKRDICISVILGVVFARCGKTDFPSATTNPSLRRQEACGSQGSTALKATESSSVHSGCGRPSSSYNRSNIDF